MSTPVDKFDPHTIHTLDVAFSSDATPVWAAQPIAMAYGFAYGADTESMLSMAEGQMKETLKLNQQVYFKIFDTAPYKDPGVHMVRMLITWENNKSPFSWTKRQFPGDESPPGIRQWDQPRDFVARSFGCNVIGVTSWLCGPYRAVNLGDFECTIWITVKTADGTEKGFIVDPEMVIKGN